MFGADGGSLRDGEEAPRHVRWEPTHFTGLSLKLTVRLPCLRKFLVLSVRRREKEEKDSRERKRRERVCFSGNDGADLPREEEWTDPKHEQMLCVSCSQKKSPERKNRFFLFLFFSFSIFCVGYSLSLGFFVWSSSIYSFETEPEADGSE